MGAGTQGPGPRAYRRWNTADFSHSAGTAPIITLFIPGTPLHPPSRSVRDPFNTASGVRNAGAPWLPAVEHSRLFAHRAVRPHCSAHALPSQMAAIGINATWRCTPIAALGHARGSESGWSVAVHCSVPSGRAHWVHGAAEDGTSDCRCRRTCLLDDNPIMTVEGACEFGLPPRRRPRTAAARLTRTAARTVMTAVIRQRGRAYLILLGLLLRLHFIPQGFIRL